MSIGAKCLCVDEHWLTQHRAHLLEGILTNGSRLPVELHCRVLNYEKGLCHGSVLKCRQDPQHLQKYLGSGSSKTLVEAGRAKILTLWACDNEPLKGLLDAYFVQMSICPLKYVSWGSVEGSG